MINKVATSLFTLLLPALLLSQTGCQLLMRHPFRKETETETRILEADEKNPVVEVICLWEPAEGTTPEGLPCRGFAGQILYFCRNEEAPIRSAGDVRIYVFDDQGTQEEQQKPLHEFHFDSGSFQQFYAETSLGGAYRIFIPYTRHGGMQARCSLRVRLTPPNGQPVYSKMATVILSGPTAEGLAGSQPIGEPSSEFNRIQQASYSVPASQKNAPAQSLVQPALAEAAFAQELSLGGSRLDRAATRSQLYAKLAEHSPAAAAPAPAESLAPAAEPEEPTPHVLRPYQQKSEPQPVTAPPLLGNHPLLEP